MRPYHVIPRDRRLLRHARFTMRIVFLFYKTDGVFEKSVSVTAAGLYIYIYIY